MMLNVPKKANDALHLSLLEGCDVSIDALGDVVLQDSFTVWDPKQLIRKGRDRHIFLFELYLLFTKEVKDSAGKVCTHLVLSVKRNLLYINTNCPFVGEVRL